MNEKESIERVEKYIKSFNGNALDCIAIGTVLTLLKKKDKQIERYQNMLVTNDMLHVFECEKKDKIIDEIQKEVREHISFENRLKRDNRETDLFNQGRFYVANNIKDILKMK